jgi:transposase-like protein
MSFRRSIEIMKEPKTLQEAIVYFSDPQRCFEYAVQMRWLGGEVTCPRCGQAKHSFIKTRRIWFCYVCKKQFTVKVGTVMEDSPITLDKWMTAFWMVANCKNGISSHELGRMLGVHQESAWFMLQRIREAMKGAVVGKVKLGGNGGPVEVDETYIGPNTRKMHASRRLKMKSAEYAGSKASVFGMLDRERREVRAKVVPNVKRETLQNEILKQIEGGSTIYSDNFPVYDRLAAKEFIHETVTHVEEYVRGQVHTQGIENFWALLKRGLRGTYVAVEPFHLARYIDEQVFRYNNRKHADKSPMTDSERFKLAMSQVSGRRLTYSDLTGKDESPRHVSTGTGETQVPF